MKKVPIARRNPWPRRIVLSVTLVTTVFACYRIGWPNIPDLVRGQVSLVASLGRLIHTF